MIFFFHHSIVFRESNTHFKKILHSIVPIISIFFFSGRGGNRKTQQQQNQISAEDQLKIKMYKLKYDKYLNLKPQTNSPFDTLIKATQVMYFLCEIFHEFKTICFIFIIKSF